MYLFIVQNKKEKCYVPKSIYLVSNVGVKPARLFLKLMIQQKISNVQNNLIKLFISLENKNTFFIQKQLITQHEKLLVDAIVT